MVSLKQLFEWFTTGKFPTEAQFAEQFKSFWHKSEKIAMSYILGLVDALNSKASKEELANATTNNKGIYSTDALLIAAYLPATNRKDFYAFVGTQNPFRKWEVAADGGQWIDTGEDINIADIDLAEYAKKTDVEIKTDKTVILNVSQLNNKYDYADKQTARNAVPADRALGQIISYKLASGEWVTEQFEGDNLNDWLNDEKWKSVGGDAELTAPNILNLDSYVVESTTKQLNLGNGTESANNGVLVKYIYKYPLSKGDYILSANFKNAGSNHIKRVLIYDSAGVFTKTLVNTDIKDNKFNIQMPTDGFVSFFIYYDVSTEGDYYFTIADNYAFIAKQENLIAYSILELDSYVVESTTKKLNLEKGTEDKNDGTLVKYIYKYPIEEGNYILSADFANAGSDDVKYFLIQDQNGTVARRLSYADIVDNKLTFDIETKSYLSFYLFHDTLNGKYHYDITGNYSLSKAPSKKHFIQFPDGFLFDVDNIKSKSGDTEKTVIDITSYKEYALERPASLIDVRINADFGSLTIEKNKVPCEIFLQYRNGITYRMLGTIAFQGASSIVHPKKNYAIKLLTKKGKKQKIRFGEWVYTNSFHLKANYQDFTQARNIACARLVYQITSNRKIGERFPFEKPYSPQTSNINDRISNGARCVIDGFPIEMYANSVYMGLFTLNLAKSDNNYYQDEDNENHIHMEMVGYGKPEHMFSYPVQWYAWNMRLPEYKAEKEPPASNQKTKVEEFMQWIGGIKDADTFRAESSQHLHNKYNMTMYVICHAFGHYDSRVKNTQLLSWDGQRFALCLYDMDSTFKLQPGGGLLSWDWGADADMDKYGNNKLFEYYYKAFKPELVAMWNELKQNELSYNNVKNTYLDIINMIGLEAYQRDVTRWPDIPSNTKCYTDINQVMSAYEERLAFMDKKFG